jgi:hypothetical protein
MNRFYLEYSRTETGSNRVNIYWSILRIYSCIVGINIYENFEVGLATESLFCCSPFMADGDFVFLTWTFVDTSCVRCIRRVAPSFVFS